MGHRRFQDGEDFRAGFHLALPAVNGLHRRYQIGTSDELRLDQDRANLTRLISVWKRYQYA